MIHVVVWTFKIILIVGLTLIGLAISDSFLSGWIAALIYAFISNHVMPAFKEELRRDLINKK